MYLWIGERSEAIVVLLAGRVPQTEAHCDVVDDHRRRVVVEHGGQVLFGKCVRRVRYEHGRLADCAVAHDHQFDWVILTHLSLLSFRSFSLYLCVYVSDE